MAILYNIPRVAAENQFRQLGPTCWYYVSEMLLRFHNKLDGVDEKLVDAFRLLGELRKAFTAMGDDSKERRGEKAKVIGELEDRMNPVDHKIREIEGKLAAYQSGVYREHLNRIKSYWESKKPDFAERQRIERAIAILSEIEEDWSARLNLLEAFVPTAGFVSFDKDKVFESKESLETFLEKAGPFYLGGAMSITVQTDAPVVTPEMQDFANALGVPVPLERTINRDATMILGPKLSSGDQVVSILGVNQGSAHAIAVAGIKGDTVYYKDPNQSDKVMCLPFDLMQKAANKVIAITCMACTHKAAMRIDFPAQ